MLNLILLYNFLFSHDLEGINIETSFKFDKFNPPKSPISQRTQDFEVIPLQLFENFLIIFFKSVIIGLFHVWLGK